MLSEEKKKELEKAIKAKLSQGSMLVCPMCKEHDFTIADGYMVNMLFSDISITKVEGNLFPVAILVCKNCGFVSQHAVNILYKKKES